VTEEGGWQRFHPLTPLLRGGVTLLAIGAWVISNQFDAWFGREPALPQETPLAWTALAALGVITLVVLTGWLTWRVSRFRIGETTLELRTGLLFRQHRQVRYDRIQAVDVNRPLLARLTGLSEVKVQAAGGTDADAKLAFLPDARAHEVRDQLMGLAGRSDEVTSAPDSATGSAAGPVTRAEAIVRVPSARLLQAAAFSGRTLFILTALPAVLGSFVFDVPALLPFFGPALLAVGGSHLGSLVREWNFELVRDRDGIRVRRGLTEIKSSSIPVHRIQVVSVRQPMFWRLTDWWRVEINVAGVGPGSSGNESVVLPVGTREEALRVVRVLRPATDPAVLVAGMVGDGEGTAYVIAPEGARWVSPIVLTRHGYAVTPDSLMVRGGRLRRFVHVVPHARIQSLTLRQGPLQRRLGLASLHILSTPGSSDPWVEHLALDTATALLNEQVQRSGLARTRV
jgi:putative membrane protein